MSVTVADILKLPCFIGAEVVAGKKGLGKTVFSVNVLEYADTTPLLDQMFNHNEFLGSEIIITGFMNVTDNVEAQCANIRRYHGVGAAGMILYYVGVFLPGIDQRLIDLCNELDFALISMPRNRIDLRYSEAICEIMDAIFRDQAEDTYFVSKLLERFSLLPPHQRSMDTLLKMLSDQLRASVVLTDATFHKLNAATWPRGMKLELSSLIRQVSPEDGGWVRAIVEQEEKHYYISRCPVLDISATDLQLYLIKDGETLKADVVRQAGELVQLFIHIWSKNHGEVVASELVRAILRDEPLKMRRLSQLFHIDSQALHSMWLLRAEATAPRRSTESATLGAIALCNEILQPFCSTLLMDRYEDFFVIFMDLSLSEANCAALSEQLSEQLRQRELPSHIVRCDRLVSTSEVRQAFLKTSISLPTALLLYPTRTIFTMQEIRFADTCRQILEQGELAAQAHMAVLASLGEETDRTGELLDTLTVYLLDEDSNVAKTAERLFVHKNTVKYRIHIIEERLGLKVNRMPDAFSAYLAVALGRILSQLDPA